MSANPARYPILLREESVLPATMAESARRGRRWRSGDALYCAQFLPFREETASRNYHRLRSRGRCLRPDDGNLLGPPLLKGNKVTALENGEQIFPALLKAIRCARHTITFENFLFKEGEVSDAFAEALAERARAGVKVHFLQDALGCDCLHGRAMNLVRRAGVQLEIFRFVNVAMNFRTIASFS